MGRLNGDEWFTCVFFMQNSVERIFNLQTVKNYDFSKNHLTIHCSVSRSFFLTIFFASLFSLSLSHLYCFSLSIVRLPVSRADVTEIESVKITQIY